MKVVQKRWIRFRTYLVAGFFVLGLGVMLARAYQLQVLESGRLQGLAKADYWDRIELPPKRGGIYDRGGHALALSVEVGSVYARPKSIKDKNKVARDLSRVLGENRRRILSCIRSNRPFVWIKRRVSPPMAEKIRELKIDGIGVVPDTRRYYPGCELAAHLIGFVGADNRGLEGLEKKYDGLLKGPPESLLQMQDALGRPFFIRRTEPSGYGVHDLVLTIDKDIQYKAEQSLEAAVNKTKAKSGQCIVVDPSTGAILAMAVVPEFNPNIFSQYHPGQWRNRIVTDCFEPGSTMKAFLLGAALQEHAVTPNTKFNCDEGSIEIAGRTIHDAHPHGVLAVRDIIKYSSNIGAIKIGRKLGYKKYYEYLEKFGFDSKTGIGLPGEQKGFIRDPDTARPIEEDTSFFGQGLTVTCLQLAMAMGAIANGGKLMRPYVVSRVLDSSGRIVQRTDPKVVRRVLPESTCKEVARILEGVVEEKGTAPEAAIQGFQVAGKTGTAQKVDPKTRRYSLTKYDAVFAGFVPVDHPRLVIVVMVDEPKGIPYGGVVAGPVFREVGLWSLNYLRVCPDTAWASKESDRGSATSPVRATGDSCQGVRIRLRIPILARDGRLPDFTGQTMREVLRNGRALGLKVDLDGSGLAFKQYPRPGVSLKKVSVLKVRFKPPA